jgi:hypothetical protein
MSGTVDGVWLRGRGEEIEDLGHAARVYQKETANKRM